MGDAKCVPAIYFAIDSKPIANLHDLNFAMSMSPDSPPLRNIDGSAMRHHCQEQTTLVGRDPIFANRFDVRGELRKPMAVGSHANFKCAR